MRSFEAKDGTGSWLAFPADHVRVLDDLESEGSDPIVLVLDRKRAGALGVMALCNRDILGTLAGLMDAIREVGIEGNAVTVTRQLGVDIAQALDWDVNEGDAQ
jgi:hypothetical protein